MGAYMQLLPDPHSQRKSGKEEGLESPVFVGEDKDGPRFYHVRRPVRGTQFKGESYATLEIKSKDGKNLLLFDSGSSTEVDNIGYSTKYSNFLLQNVQEARMERNQIMETFGPSYIWFFGERPTMLSFSGIVLNSADFNWKNEFLKNYDLYFRGTQCVTNAAKAYITYDDVVKQGYILSVDVGMSAEQPEFCDLRFQMIQSSHVDLSSVGDVRYPKDPLFDDEGDLIVDDSSPNNPRQHTFGKISDNEDEFIARYHKNPQNGQTQFERTKSLEDLVRAWFTEHGMEVPGANPVPNLDNIGGSGISIKQIMGWAGSATFTTANLVRESRAGLSPEDRNAEETVDKARTGGIASRIGRLT